MQVLSIHIGQAVPLAVDGRQVLSAIHKTAVQGPVGVQRLGLVGDEQADLSVHGGLAKAVYAYPSEHYAYWRSTHPDLALPFGAMGENLTLCGLLEADVYIGDELRFPDCVLRVTEPRQPCFKFNAVMRNKLAGKAMAQTGYSGFYLAVASPGSMAAGQGFELVAGPRQSRLNTLFKTAVFKTRLD